jgi:uncharacterized protein YbaR (Trm112 family)
VDDLPRRELRRLIARLGTGICLEPRRFEDELAASCGHFEKEVFVLVAALRKDVVSELLRGSDPSPIGVRVARFADRLCAIGVERQAASWAAETWAIALGLIQVVEQPASPEVPAEPTRINYQCPHCHQVGAVETPGRVVCDGCRWISLVDAGGTTRGPEDLIVVKCPFCKEDGQHTQDGFVQCERCDRWIRLDDEGRVLSEVEVECPNPECDVTHQFMKAELPKRVECDSCGWGFEVDAEGRVRASKGLINVECPFCNRASQYYSAGEVECYQPGCGRTLVIDERGRVLNQTIETDCPKCEFIETIEAAGWVVCTDCGHKYSIDENGDIVDPGEGVWEVECENPACKRTFYKEASSEDEHFAGGYECSYCGFWHDEDEDNEDEEDDEDEDEDEEDEVEGDKDDEEGEDA